MFIFSLTSGSDFGKIFLCKNILASSTNNVYCSWPYPRHWYKQDKEYALSHDILKTQHYTSINSLRPSYAYICVSKTIIIVSDNGLSPARRQAIIWTNDGILLIGHLGTHFSEIIFEMQISLLKKIRLNLSSAKCCQFRFGLTVLRMIVHHWFMWMIPCRSGMTEVVKVVSNAIIIHFIDIYIVPIFMFSNLFMSCICTV